MGELSKLPNIGKEVEGQLNKVGIFTYVEMNYLLCYSYTNYKAQLKNNKPVCARIFGLLFLFMCLIMEGKG